jgi:hypothetical protein
MADARGEPGSHVPHAAGGLAGVVVTGYRNHGVDEVTDLRYGRASADGAQVQGERIGQPLPGSFQLRARRARHLAGQDAHRAGRQAELSRRLARRRAAAEHRLQQIGAPLPGQVGGIPVVQQVQRGEPGRLGESLGTLLGQRPADSQPQRAEHLWTDPHCHGNSRQHPAVETRYVDRTPGLVEVAEHAALLQHLQVPGRNPPPQDRLDPAAVGFLLAA